MIDPTPKRRYSKLLKLKKRLIKILLVCVSGTIARIVPKSAPEMAILYLLEHRMYLAVDQLEFGNDHAELVEDLLYQNIFCFLRLNVVK